MVVASLEEIAASVTAACDKASKCKDALAAAQDLTEDAEVLLVRALKGDTTGDKDGVLAAFAEVVKGITDLWKALDKGTELAQTVLDRLLGADARSAADPRVADAPGVSAIGARAIPPERVAELRRELPPPVVSGTGRKTHGRWVGPDGAVHAIVSGGDEWTPKVNDALAAEGCPKIPVRVAVDVELKPAAWMRAEGETNPAMRHVTVVINAKPCKGPFSCDRLLPVILPEGYSLTVYAPDYRKRFTGGEKPWR